LTPSTRQVKEFTEDVQPFWDNKAPLSNDLWLREGDVVEVADKP
jgi:hypothetical protein